MSKYILTEISEEDESKITMEFEAECLPDIINKVKFFLKGCSFIFEDLRIEK